MRTVIYMLAALLLASAGAQAQSRGARQKAKKAVQTVDPQKEKESALFAEMLPNTRKLFIVDSVVVDAGKLAEALPLSGKWGAVTSYNKFFNADKPQDTYVCVNGFGDKCLYAEMSADSTYSLYSREMVGKEWSEPRAVQGLDHDFAKMAFPCMMSDGTTVYFSATSDDGLGGYDIYVTSYDQAEGRYMRAENIGLPFNSGADDLLYIEDDTDSLAWLATTRRQPEGKVCIYTIALSPERQGYDTEYVDESELRGYASIASIKDTWPSEKERKAQLARIAGRSGKDTGADAAEEEAFVVDDNTVCHSADDFSTAENKRLYNSIQTKRRQQGELSAELDQLRGEYYSATPEKRKQLAQRLLSAEQEYEQLNGSIGSDVRKLRRDELAARRK